MMPNARPTPPSIRAATATQTFDVSRVALEGGSQHLVGGPGERLGEPERGEREDHGPGDRGRERLRGASARTTRPAACRGGRSSGRRRAPVWSSSCPSVVPRSWRSARFPVGSPGPHLDGTAVARSRGVRELGVRRRRVARNAIRGRPRPRCSRRARLRSRSGHRAWVLAAREVPAHSCAIPIGPPLERADRRRCSHRIARRATPLVRPGVDVAHGAWRFADPPGRCHDAPRTGPFVPEGEIHEEEVVARPRRGAAGAVDELSVHAAGLHRARRQPGPRREDEGALHAPAVQHRQRSRLPVRGRRAYRTAATSRSARPRGARTASSAAPSDAGLRSRCRRRWRRPTRARRTGSTSPASPASPGRRS